MSYFTRTRTHTQTNDKNTNVYDVHVCVCVCVCVRAFSCRAVCGKKVLTRYPAPRLIIIIAGGTARSLRARSPVRAAPDPSSSGRALESSDVDVLIMLSNAVDGTWIFSFSFSFLSLFLITLIRLRSSDNERRTVLRLYRLCVYTRDCTLAARWRKKNHSFGRVYAGGG